MGKAATGMEGMEQGSGHLAAARPAYDGVWLLLCCGMSLGYKAAFPAT